MFGHICPICGAPEIEDATRWTVYQCGSKDCAQVPGTFIANCSEQKCRKPPSHDQGLVVIVLTVPLPNIILREPSA